MLRTCTWPSTVYCRSLNTSCNVSTEKVLMLILLPFYSFVRSVTMDKWKDLEVEKMKVSSIIHFMIYLFLGIKKCNIKWVLVKEDNSYWSIRSCNTFCLPQLDSSVFLTGDVAKWLRWCIVLNLVRSIQVGLNPVTSTTSHKPTLNSAVNLWKISKWVPSHSVTGLHQLHSCYTPSPC